MCSAMAHVCFGPIADIRLVLMHDKVSYSRYIPRELAFRKFASPASDTSTHFEFGDASVS